MFSTSERGGVVRTPPALLRARVKCCAERLSHAAALALIAADGPEPEYGAAYLACALDAAGSDLRLFRAAMRERGI